MNQSVARINLGNETASFGLATGGAILLSKYPKRFKRMINVVDGHWLWNGYVNSNGYVYKRAGPKRVRAHRWSYEYAYGAIPKGLVIDHTCRIKHCLNPYHLEAVSSKVNSIRHHQQSNNIKLYKCPNCGAEHYKKEPPTWI